MEDEEAIPQKGVNTKEHLQNGSIVKSNAAGPNQCVSNGSSAIKALNQILANAESSENSPTPEKPKEDSDVDVPVIEEDMNLEDLMRQKVSKTNEKYSSFIKSNISI